MSESPTVLNVNGLRSKSIHLSKKCSSTIHCITLRFSCWPSMLSPSERLPFQNSVCLSRFPISRFPNWITCAVQRTFPWCNHSCETRQVRVLFFLQYTTLLTQFCPPHETRVCVCVCHNIHHEADGDNPLNFGNPLLIDAADCPGGFHSNITSNNKC